MATYAIPAVGQMVRVRARRHVVEAVRAPRPDHPSEQHLVALACVDDDNAGDRSEVLWETEPDARVLSPAHGAFAPEALDPVDHFAAWYHALRWSCLSVADDKRLQAPFRAGITVEAYQLEPLRKALAQPRVRLFIADDVGLGKTIEAALIVRELMIRQRVSRVVVAAPPGVVSQWRDELDERFGLAFVVVDREYLRARRRERGWRFNPWRAHRRFIISHALLRDPHYTTALRELLREEPEGSMLVLDEAHHAAPASGGRVTVDSAFTRTVRELAPLFEHRVFLSATPHNGHSNSFSALMEILDLSRFVRGIKVERRQLDRVMVRRLKSHLRAVGVRFPARKVSAVHVRGLPQDDPDLLLPRLLDAYCERREELVANAARSQRTNTLLVLTTLRKRLLSSVEAFRRTLAAHRRGLAKAAVAREVPLPLFEAPGADDEREAPEDAELRAEDAVAAASALPDALAPDLTAALDQLTALAERHAGRDDARVSALLDWIRANLRDGDRWNRRRVIVFTEYVDTQRYLRARLEAAFRADRGFHRRLALLDGSPEHDDARDEVKLRFNTDPDEEPLRILLCTDAAREGINLQAHCADLFHFDLPWNPSRLEQRNGRIDRKGQPEEEVRCHYFVYVQRPEDAVLDALVRKTETIRKELGAMGEVLAGEVTKALAQGISRRRAQAITEALDALPLFAPRAEETDDVTVSDPSPARAAEELDGDVTPAALNAAKADNDRLRAEAEAAMEFSAERFRQCLDVALARAGAPPLARDPQDPSRWHLAPLDGSPATLDVHAALSARRIDASWAETLDGLRIPYGLEPGHDERPYPPSDRWTWRRRSRLRPLRFEASETARADSVHMHLEHRVAQRLIGQLTAQGFTQGALSRVTAVTTRRGVDRVLLLARLCLFGARGQRLHDELIARVAPWHGPEDEGGAAPVFGRDATDVRQDLDEVLGGAAVAAFHERRVLRAVARDVAALEPQLRRAAATQVEAVRERLDRLGARMAQDLDAQLDRQVRALEERLSPARQLTLFAARGFSDGERLALQGTLRAWERRREDLLRERETAPGAVREGYAVRHEHVEVLGAVYLLRA